MIYLERLVNQIVLKWNTIFKKEVIQLQSCKCGNNIDINLYNKKIKRHVIGAVFKNNKIFTLYCDGKERLNKH